MARNYLLKYTRLFLKSGDISGDSRTVSRVGVEAGGVDITTWDDKVDVFREGRASASMRGYQALLNTDSRRSWDLLDNAPSNNQAFTLALGGGGEPDTGDPAYLMYGLQLSNIVSDQDGILVITTDFLQDALKSPYYDPFGHVLHGTSAVTATTNHPSIDYGVATTKGAFALLHVINGGGDWSFVIQHSTNKITWTTLMTFLNDGSSEGYESQSTTGTVNKHTRLRQTQSGTGSVEAIVSICRGK